MSLATRLRALERDLDALDLDDLCAKCGPPEPFGGGAVLLHDGEEAKRCADCERVLSERGRPLRRWGKVIHLHP